MKDETVLKLAAIGAIFGLDSIAIIVLRVDGTLLVGAASLIAGIAGYGIASLVGKPKQTPRT